MLLPNFLWWTVLVVILLGGLAGMGAVGEAVSSKWLRRLALLGVVLVGGFLLVVWCTIPTVWIVREDGGEVEAVKKHLIGSSSWTLASGTSVPLERDGEKRVLVVNDTKDVQVRVTESLYGYGATGDSGLPMGVAPGEVRATRSSVDLVGPDDPPPSTVKSKSSTARKVWLTWERTSAPPGPEPEPRGPDEGPR